MSNYFAYGKCKKGFIDNANSDNQKTLEDLIHRIENYNGDWEEHHIVLLKIDLYKKDIDMTDHNIFRERKMSAVKFTADT